MNPCSPRFVYLFVVLRILVRAVNFHYTKIVIICDIHNKFKRAGAKIPIFFERIFIIH